MVQEQNYQVNYTINVDASQGTRQVIAFGEAVEAFSVFSSAVLVTVMLVMFIRFGFLISIGQGYGFRLLAVVI